MSSIKAIDTRNFPSFWVICPCCQGEGKTSAHMGGFTSTEWAEQDGDFKASYLSGAYDRACPSCRGTGKLREVDFSRCTFSQKRVLAKQIREELDQAAYAAESAADRLAEQRHCGYEG